MPVPLAALAAGGAVAGWLVGRSARSSELAGAEPAAAATTPTAADATSASQGSASLDWGQDLGGGGSLPYASPVSGDQGYDYGTGNYPPAQSPPPSPPAPSGVPLPGPAPAPTGTLIAKPRTPPPSGAVGWTIVRVGQGYYNPVGSWNGSYPVHVGGVVLYQSRSARWISGLKTAILPNGSSRSVRRVSHKDTVDGNWANDFVNAAVAIYPTTTSSVRV